MKPDHFKNTKPLGSCAECHHRLWVLDKESFICTRHAFTLVDPLNEHVCDNFANPTKPARRSALDILVDISSPFPTLCDKPRTLVIENAYVESSSLAASPHSTQHRISGHIDGYNKGLNYQIKFQATDVLVEE